MGNCVEITKECIFEMLDAKVGNFQPKRVICKQCGYFDGPGHKLIYCNKCGGEFINVAEWTVFNLLQRIKPHLSKGYDNVEANWLPLFLAIYLEKKHKISFMDAYSYTFDEYKKIKEWYVEYLKSK